MRLGNDKLNHRIASTIVFGMYLIYKIIGDLEYYKDRYHRYTAVLPVALA